VRLEQHVEGAISYSKRRASAVFQPEIMNPNNEMTYCMSVRKEKKWRLEERTAGIKNGLRRIVSSVSKLKGFLQDHFDTRFKRGFNSICICGQGMKMVAHTHCFFWGGRVHIVAKSAY
jgi:hypothetical protein